MAIYQYDFLNCGLPISSLLKGRDREERGARGEREIAKGRGEGRDREERGVGDSERKGQRGGERREYKKDCNTKQRCMQHVVSSLLLPSKAF